MDGATNCSYCEFYDPEKHPANELALNAPAECVWGYFLREDYEKAFILLREYQIKRCPAFKEDVS